MTPNQHDPYALGCTHDTMVNTMGSANPQGGANPTKIDLSPD